MFLLLFLFKLLSLVIIWAAVPRANEWTGSFVQFLAEHLGQSLSASPVLIWIYTQSSRQWLVLSFFQVPFIGERISTSLLFHAVNSGPVLQLPGNTVSSYYPTEYLFLESHVCFLTKAQQEPGSGPHIELCFCTISSPRRYLPCFMSMAMSSFSPLKFYLSLLYVWNIEGGSFNTQCPHN